MKKIYVLAALMATLLIFGQQVYAFGGPGNGRGVGGDAGGAMMQSKMTTPLVASSDGTAYVASINTSGLTSGSFTSNITAIALSGAKQAIAVNGMVKSLVIGKDTSSMDMLVAVAANPPTINSTTTGSMSTVLNIISLPFNQNATPVSVSLDGMTASEPLFVNGYVYVTTTTMTNNGGTPSKTSNLYIIGSNGSILSQISY
ncbi:MAG: hypothetical protein H7843_06300 [Nitrospirota bacterium]